MGWHSTTLISICTTRSMQLSPNGKLSREEFQQFANALLTNPELIDLLTSAQQQTLMQQMKKIDDSNRIEDARNHLIPFIQYMWPGFTISSHHYEIAKMLEDMEAGLCTRALVSTPPRYSKSEMLSIFFPAWCCGRKPTQDTKFMIISNTDDLASTFGMKVRNLILRPEYAEIFPNAKLSKYSKAAGHFTMEGGAEVYAQGVTSQIMGKGAKFLLCDDIYGEEDVRNNKYDWALDWFGLAQQRLSPDGRVCCLHTRHSKRDLIGTLSERSKKHIGDKYRIISVPALDANDQSTFPPGPTWGWSTEHFHRLREKYSAAGQAHLFYAEYMQQPTATETSIIKRKDWKLWSKKDSKGDWVTPDCHFTLMAWDTAFTNNRRSNPTACVVFGIFEHEDENHIILLHSFQRKMELPELKRVTFEMVKEWKPDCVLVENKSSGPWVIEEFRRSGIYATAVTPLPREDKMSRLHSVADVFACGKVFYIPTPENEETITQAADFPGGTGDDLVDAMVYSVRYFKKGQFVRTSFDTEDEAPVYQGERVYYP